MVCFFNTRISSQGNVPIVHSCHILSMRSHWFSSIHCHVLHDLLLSSVHPSVCPSVCLSLFRYCSQHQCSHPSYPHPNAHIHPSIPCITEAVSPSLFLCPLTPGTTTHPSVTSPLCVWPSPDPLPHPGYVLHVVRGCSPRWGSRGRGGPWGRGRGRGRPRASARGGGGGGAWGGRYVDLLWLKGIHPPHKTPPFQLQNRRRPASVVDRTETQPGSVHSRGSIATSFLCCSSSYQPIMKVAMCKVHMDEGNTDLAFPVKTCLKMRLIRKYHWHALFVLLFKNIGFVQTNLIYFFMIRFVVVFATHLIQPWFEFHWKRRTETFKSYHAFPCLLSVYLFSYLEENVMMEDVCDCISLSTCCKAFTSVTGQSGALFKCFVIIVICFCYNAFMFSQAVFTHSHSHCKAVLFHCRHHQPQLPSQFDPKTNKSKEQWLSVATSVFSKLMCTALSVPMRLTESIWQRTGYCCVVLVALSSALAHVTNDISSALALGACCMQRPMKRKVCVYTSTCSATN